MQGHIFSRGDLIHYYQVTRQKTLALCDNLITEDYVIQGQEDVSPPKWHLAHTTWFFEEFILAPRLSHYSHFTPIFSYIFNSYYQGKGKPYPRKDRGLLARPSVETVFQYRHYVDYHLISFIEATSEEQFLEIEPLIILGINHEQQHQELLLMDIKYNFSMDPSFPSYSKPKENSNPKILKNDFIYLEEGVYEIGSDKQSFYFDNELPKHQRIIKPFLLSTRLVSNEEYCEFIEAGGYRQPQWWLSDGWDWIMNDITSPLYWHKIDNDWHIFSLSGLRKLIPHEPVSHISYFEADAYARWRGYRLPFEDEWEIFVTQKQIKPSNGNFLENEIYHPTTPQAYQNQHQLFGDLWEWTNSAYSPYPGFKPIEGTLGEYNGKFMNNQFVLKGGSCLTPEKHIRASYRNFFQPSKRWQFSGIRLANDA